MAKEADKGSKDDLTRWREAENDYRKAVAPFMKGEAIELTKSELIELVRLRHRADRRRERYFKHH